MKPFPLRQKETFQKGNVSLHIFITFYKFGWRKINLGHVTIGDTRFKLSLLICNIEIIVVNNKWENISKIFNRELNNLIDGEWMSPIMFLD